MVCAPFSFLWGTYSFFRNAPIKIWWLPLFRRQMPNFHSHKCLFIPSECPIFTSDNNPLYFDTCSFYFLISFLSPFPLIIKRAPNFKRLRAISPKSSLATLAHIYRCYNYVTFQRSFQFYCYENVLIYNPMRIGFFLFIRCSFRTATSQILFFFLARFARSQMIFSTITPNCKVWC